MLDAWIIEEQRRERRPTREFPLVQLPLHQEAPPFVEDVDEEDERDEENHSHVIVIDMA